MNNLEENILKISQKLTFIINYELFTVSGIIFFCFFFANKNKMCYNGIVF